MNKINNYDDLINNVDSSCLEEIKNIKNKKETKNIIAIIIMTLLFLIIPITVIILDYFKIIDSPVKEVLWFLPLVWILSIIPFILGIKARKKQEINQCIENYYKRMGQTDFIESSDFKEAKNQSDNKFLSWVPILLIASPFIGLLIALIMLIVCNIIGGHYRDVIIWIIILVAIIAIAIIIYIIACKEDKFKKIMTNYLKEEFSNFTYKKEGIDNQTLIEDNLIYLGSMNFTWDYLSGNYYGINFEYYELDSTTPRGKSSTLQHFKGGVIKFDYNKQLNSPLAIISKDIMLDKWNGKLYNEQFAGNNIIKTNNPNLDKFIEIYSNNYQDINTILNEQFLNVINELGIFSGNRGYLIGFKNNKIWVCLPDYDLFKTAITNKNQIIYLNRAKNDVNTILNIIYKIYNCY